MQDNTDMSTDMNPFSPGTFATLRRPRAGIPTPVMTVNAVDGDLVECVWFHREVSGGPALGPFSHRFHWRALQPYVDPQEPDVSGARRDLVEMVRGFADMLGIEISVTRR